MTLKTKSLIYRYTGIYLAQQEELDYIESPEYWLRFRKIVLHKSNDLHMTEVHSLLVGDWQVSRGFATAFYPGRSKILRFLYVFYKQLRWDLEKLCRKNS